MDRIHSMPRNMSNDKRVTDWIRHQYTNRAVHTIERTEAPPMNERMNISRLLDDNNEALTEREIYRDLAVIEINADKLRDYTGLYLEYKTQKQYPHEWQAAEELEKPIFCFWDKIDTLYTFRENKTVHVATNARDFLNEFGMPQREIPRISELEVGQSYHGAVYLGDKIGLFGLKDDNLKFHIKAVKDIFRPLEFIDNAPADKKGVYFTNNYSQLYRLVLNRETNPSSNTLHILYEDRRYSTGNTTINYLYGFVRWDANRIEQERRNLVTEPQWATQQPQQAQG